LTIREMKVKRRGQRKKTSVREARSIGDSPGSVGDVVDVASEVELERGMRVVRREEEIG